MTAERAHAEPRPRPRSGGASAPASPGLRGPAPLGKEFKLRRLAGFEYVGRYAYHLVSVVSDRRKVLVDEVADSLISDLRRAARATCFEVLAFVVMPDHVHLLVQGAADDANAIKFMQRFKQSTGFRFKKLRRSALWQRSFFDRVLRHDEDVLAVARYILDNPVRAGLIGADEDWRYRRGTLLAGAEAPPLRYEGLHD